jgi:hypothetical protein
MGESRVNKSLEPWSGEEKSNVPLRYRCELLFTNVTTSEVNDNSLPSDSYLVYYKDEEGAKVDICRGGRMVYVFDLYYDRFGSVIERIEFTKGRANPKLWGIARKKQEEANKKK